MAADEFVSRQSENTGRVPGLVVVAFLLTVVVTFNLRVIVVVKFGLDVVYFNVVADLRVVFSVDCWAFCSNGHQVN